MFARITTLHFQPDKAEQAFAVVRQAVVPSLKEQHGFQGLLLLRDSKTGSAMAVTLWESEAAMAASVMGNYPAQLAKVEGLLTEDPSRSIYEVKELGLAFHL
jgi:heme-degrading monooxygenase HmoA